MPRAVPVSRPFPIVRLLGAAPAAPHLAAPSVPSTGGDCSDPEVKQKMALPAAGERQWHRNALPGELMLMAIDWKALCIALNASLVSS